MLEFNPEKHEYTYSGIIIPGVTTVLKVAGITQDYSMINPYVLETKRDLGINIHMATEMDDLGLEITDPEFLPYIEGWKNFKKDTDFQCISAEKPAYSKKYRYAGTIDRFGTVYGESAIVDLKTTVVVDMQSVGPQTAAYQNALAEHTKEKAKKRYIVKLDPKLKQGYKLIPCTNKSDFQVFLNALNIYNWRMIKHDKH
ncbi:MAG: hypothetical protein JM58_09620 [Peptococcaceae bacterium BICA1-8]|nr:MAG: hypothetical protein JM58_09620 [Peptococcaceae bacterium BICA1-8]